MQGGEVFRTLLSFSLQPLLESLEKLEELQVVKLSQWTGKEHRYLTYRYVNQMPLKDDEEQPRCELGGNHHNQRKGKS